MILLMPLMLFSQKRHEYTFDFTKPESLNPPVTLLEEEYNGAEYSFQGIVLKSDDDLVSVSFEGREQGSLGGALQAGWPQEDGSFEHYLFIIRGGSMTITGNGVELDSLIFSEDSYVGNLKLLSPSGIGAIDQRNESWFGNVGEDINRLHYHNYGQIPRIRSFKVIYRSPLDILEPKYVIPSDYSEVRSFQKFEMSFTTKVTIADTAKVYLIGPNNLNEELTFTKKDDYNIVASLPEGLEVNTVSDEYKIVINKGSLITNDNDAYYNKQLTYHFSIIPNYATFELESVNPAAGNIDHLEDGIQLTFTDVVSNTISSERIYITNRENKRVRTARLVKSEDNPKMVYVRFEEDNKLPIPAEILNEKIGYYTLIIPEGYINNYLYDDLAEDKGKSQGAQFNPEIKVTYNVGNAVYPDDPTLLHKADSLLATSGVGYPATDSEARVALQNLIESIEEGQVTNNLIKDAIDAFYSETNIEQPQSAKYYVVSAVSPNGNELYLRYSNGAITLTNDSIDATHFLAQVNEDKTLTLICPDGKYLQQLMPDNENISNEYDAIKNNFTLAQFRLDGKSHVDCFGLWSIKCWVATGEGNNNMSAFARVDFSSSKFATSILFPSLNYFEEEMTNAFRLTETNAPVPEVKSIIDPEDESSIDDLYKITVSFTNINEVEITENAKENITLVGSSTLLYRPANIGLVEGSKNKCQLFFDDVQAGSYKLTIPKGTFSWTYDNRKIQIPEITAKYTVKKGTDFVYNLIDSIHVYLYNMPDVVEKVKDTDLNNILTLVIYKENTFGLANKEVTITSTSDTVIHARGHLVFDDSFVDPAQSPSTAFKLVLDKPIKAGDLAAGTYQFNIPKATFGDANFAAWLKDPHSVPKDLCHVNPFMNPFVSVDNDMANLEFSPENLKSVVERLSDITVTFPYHDNVVIPDSAINVIEIWEKNRQFQDVRLITTSFVPVEGTTNKFRLASDEILTRSRGDGFYYIIIPQYLFKAGNELMPTYGHIDLYYYGQGSADAIEGINASQQDEVIFDLSGRRVKDMNKAGIYIVGGRKVVVK